MGFSSGRRAYAGVSIDSIIDKLGPRSSIIPCVQQVLVDGTNLTAALHTQRTPNPLDPRPHTKYDEAFMVRGRRMRARTSAHFSINGSRGWLTTGGPGHSHDRLYIVDYWRRGGQGR